MLFGVGFVLGLLFLHSSLTFWRFQVIRQIYDFLPQRIVLNVLAIKIYLLATETKDKCEIRLCFLRVTPSSVLDTSSTDAKG